VAPRTDTFSAQDVADQLHARGIHVGRATVFRTIDLMADLGFLHRIQNDDGYHRYTVCADEEHHHHARCVDCGAVLALHAPGLEREIDRIAQEADFQVLDHILELVGRCPLCRGSR
jgi:Fur family ferric uptake transcriptional regulator